MMPFEECPRFSFCDVNHCPLDPAMDKRPNLPGEEKCTLGKTRRKRIGARYLKLLPMGGLRSREYKAKLAWDNLPKSEKKRRKEAFLAAISGSE